MLGKTFVLEQQKCYPNLKFNKVNPPYWNWKRAVMLCIKKQAPWSQQATGKKVKFCIY